MMSSDSSANPLAEYLAGRLTAEQVVSYVATAYYREQEARSRAQWRPIIELIDRAHPGVVELSATTNRPGFDVRLAERPFPKRYEVELRQAVQALLGVGRDVEIGPPPPSPLPPPSLLSRMVAAIPPAFRSPRG